MYVYIGARDDATNDEGLKEVRGVPTITPHNIDMAMLCDIQHIVSRLAGKYHN